MRDYLTWHEQYDDPDSDMSWRLGRVRDYLRTALAGGPGPMDVLSLCAGDGRDVIGVLAEGLVPRPVRATLVEIDPVLADRARAAAADAGLGSVQVRTADAADTDSYADVAPADVVLLVGILGNISVADIRATIAHAPQLCRPGGFLLWSRGLDDLELNPQIRSWFVEEGFTELDYAEHPGNGSAALGLMRHDGPSRPLVPAHRLFAFED